MATGRFSMSYVCGLAFAAALAAIAAGAAGPPAAPTAAPVPAPPPALPPAPAFYTEGLSRVRDIQGDSFTFVRDDGQAVRVRLLDADSESLGESIRGQAQAVAVKLLEEAPVWVFPSGQAQAGAPGEIWADVWTSKGFLSQVLLRAGYAQRRTQPALSSLARPDAAGTSNKGPAPPAPALLATSCKAVSGDTFEIQEGAKKLTARLFDVAAEGDSDATAARLVGAGAVWVFPCTPRPLDGKSPWPVRIWTAEGWLSDALLRAGQAKPSEGVEKTAIAAKPAATPRPEPVKRPAVQKPAEPQIEWRPISVVMARSKKSSWVVAAIRGSDTSSGGAGGNYADEPSNAMESEVFKITTGAWRVSWEAKIGNKTNQIIFQVFRCGGNSPDSTSKSPSSQVVSYNAAKGAQVLRTMAGNYWVKVTGSIDASMTIEEAYPKSPTP
jgi:endonuclease YncB( thermonuclease family)